MVNFLKVNCNMESETILVILKNYITFKFNTLGCTWNRSFTYGWFCDFAQWSTGRYWFTELCNYSRCSHISLYNIWKKPLNIISDAYDNKSKFSHLKAQSLSLAKPVCLHWSDELTLFISKKQSSVNNSTISTSHSWSKNDILRKR